MTRSLGSNLVDATPLWLLVPWAGLKLAESPPNQIGLLVTVGSTGATYALLGLVFRHGVRVGAVAIVILSMVAIILYAQAEPFAAGVVQGALLSLPRIALTFCPAPIHWQDILERTAVMVGWIVPTAAALALGGRPEVLFVVPVLAVLSCVIAVMGFREAQRDAIVRLKPYSVIKQIAAGFGLAVLGLLLYWIDIILVTMVSIIRYQR